MAVEQLFSVSCTPSITAVTACVNGDIRDGLRYTQLLTHYSCFVFPFESH